jgi:hypothetical protein
MADPLQFNTPFNLKNFLGSKGTSGLESIFKYVPDRMKISILQAMHKMHPTQAENFMVNIYNEWVSKLGSIDASGNVYHGKDFHSWIGDKIQHRTIPGSGYDIGKPLSLSGPWAGGQDTGYTNIEKIPYEHIKKLKIQLADPNLDAGTRKIINEMLERAIYDASDAGKYNKVLMDQLEKSGVKTITSISPEGVDMGKSILIDKTIPEGDVVDFKTRKILNPKTPFDPNELMVSKRSLPFLRRKPIPPGQRMTRVPPVPKGIPWSNIGMGILNHPITRGIGVAGDVALGGMAISDVMGGTNFVGDSVRGINEMIGVPMDRHGNAIRNIPTYRNLRNVAQRDVLNPNEMRGVTSFDTTRYNPREMNTGGIVSLMV